MYRTSAKKRLELTRDTLNKAQRPSVGLVGGKDGQDPSMRNSPLQIGFYDYMQLQDTDDWVRLCNANHRKEEKKGFLGRLFSKIKCPYLR